MTILDGVREEPEEAVCSEPDLRIMAGPGKSLTCAGKDLKKLSTSEGCALSLVSDRVYTLDDYQLSDDDDDDDDDDEMDCASQLNQQNGGCQAGETLQKQPLDNQMVLERAKRELISLALNSNRDPIKPGSSNKLRRLIADEVSNPDQDQGDEFSEADLMFELADDGFTRIHRRYKDLRNYEATLLAESNSFEEISPARVFKRRLTAGIGPLVTENSLVIYNCAFWTEQSSEPYDSTWLRRNTVVTDLSNDFILPGLRELLLTTRRSEWCEAFIKPEAAFGRLGARPRIPPNATLFCLLEVVRVVSNDRIEMLSFRANTEQTQGAKFEDFYDASNEARTRGNYYHEQRHYKAALQRYKSGIRILEALTYKDENEEKKGKVLLLKLYNNCARAANALGDPRLALSACKLASMIDDKDPKTYWNRMIAWKKKGHLDRALGVAHRAMQLFSDSMTRKPFAREADILKRLIKSEQDELKDLHRLMGRSILT